MIASGRSYSVVALRASTGFPLRAGIWEFGYARNEMGMPAQQRLQRSSRVILGGIAPQRIAETDIHLPQDLLWPGFAINTLFYAAMLWLLFAAPFALRRRRRIKRGLCPACAYPVGASDLCTECGKPVKRRAATTMPSND
jgi:hypothetical protein